MPAYDYKCNNCGKLFERILPLSSYQEPQTSPCCTTSSTKVLSAPYVRGDYEGYTCPVSGKWVEGRVAHAENLKRTGCRILEPGEKEAVIRSKQKEEQDFDSALDLTIEKELDSLSSDKKAQLANEVSSGLTVSVTRT